MAESDEISVVEFSLAESRFDTDKEGWSTQGDCTMTHSLTDGNPGGCLKAADAVSGGVFYYLAPKKFLGVKHNAYQLDYDIKWVANESLVIFKWDREVEIIGGGRVLIYQSGPPPRNEWIHCSVPLRSGSGWTNTTTKLPATADDFRAVLASLTVVKIRGEFAHGGPETGYLDNVVMSGMADGLPQGRVD